MAITAIQNDNSRQMSYSKSMFFGGITGYSLKYILPITPQEKDKDFKEALAEIRAKINNAKLENLKDINTKMEFNEFVRTMKNDSNLLKILRKINFEARELKIQGLKDLVAKTKALRPTKVFVATGVVVGLTIALINNAINRLAKDDDFHPTEMDDSMIVWG